MDNKKGIWITWEKQRRNIGISKELGFELFEIIIKKRKLSRYVLSLYRTINIILRNKPEIVVAQNPSMVLAFFVVCLGKVYKYKSVIDSHNSGIYPFDGRCVSLNVLSKIIQKMSDLTIVTNVGLSKIVVENGGRSVVLPDALPLVPYIDKKFECNGEFNIAFVCSFGEDEPVDEVFNAVRDSRNVSIYVTGNPKKRFDNIPPNVHLLGFIPDEEYWRLINSVEAVMVLTKRDNCIVCGAYESVAAGKPMILSNTNAIVKYFRSGCVYTDPCRDKIKKAIIDLVENIKEKNVEIIMFRDEVSRSWKRDFLIARDVICC